MGLVPQVTHNLSMQSPWASVLVMLGCGKRHDVIMLPFLPRQASKGDDADLKKVQKVRDALAVHAELLHTVIMH